MFYCLELMPRGFTVLCLARCCFIAPLGATLTHPTTSSLGPASELRLLSVCQLLSFTAAALGCAASNSHTYVTLRKAPWQTSSAPSQALFARAVKFSVAKSELLLSDLESRFSSSVMVSPGDCFLSVIYVIAVLGFLWIFILHLRFI